MQQRIWSGFSYSFRASLPRSACLASLLALAAGAIGCTGSIGGLVTSAVGGPGSGGASGAGSAGGSVGSDGGVNPGVGGGNGGGNPDAGPTIAPPVSSLPTETPCVSQSPGPRLLRRLSAAEFAQTTADLFNDPTVPVTAVFNDPVVLGFSVDSDALLVQDLNADQLMTNAETVAAWAVMNHLSQIAPCSAFTSACGRQIIESFGRRAFRTALPDSDPRVDAYSKLFLAESNFNDGVTTVVSAMLQSPYFLYRSEIGAIPYTPGTGTVALTPYEVANSLSYLLTGSMPDSTLLAAADTAASSTGTAQTAAVAAMVTSQSTRLLTLASNQTAVMGFMSGWLGLSRVFTTVKDTTVYPLTDAQRTDMYNESSAFILDMFASNGPVSNLFTANYSFLNKNMADYYGIDDTGLGTAFVKVPYTSTTRDGGILAHASILTGYARADISSPTQRGHLVRSRLLCQNVPNPPPGLDVTLHPAVNAVTTRQLYLDEHAPAPADGGTSVCYTCHQLMDWIGVSSEHYDSFGAFRTMQGGMSIDATGTIYQADEAGDTVQINGLSGPNGLETYLAGSDDMKHCMVRYWSYYAYGTASWDQDACTYDAIQQEAANSSYGLQSTLMAIVHAPRFTTRAQDQ